MVIILQYIPVSNHHIVHIKLIDCYVSIISVKLGLRERSQNNNSKNENIKNKRCSRIAVFLDRSSLAIPSKNEWVQNFPHGPVAKILCNQ